MAPVNRVLVSYSYAYTDVSHFGEEDINQHPLEIGLRQGQDAAEDHCDG